MGRYIPNSLLTNFVLAWHGEPDWKFPWIRANKHKGRTGLSVREPLPVLFLGQDVFDVHTAQQATCGELWGEVDFTCRQPECNKIFCSPNQSTRAFRSKDILTRKSVNRKNQSGIELTVEGVAIKVPNFLDLVLSGLLGRRVDPQPTSVVAVPSPALVNLNSTDEVGGVRLMHGQAITFVGHLHQLSILDDLIASTAHSDRLWPFVFQYIQVQHACNQLTRSETIFMYNSNVRSYRIPKVSAKTTKAKFSIFWSIIMQNLESSPQKILLGLFYLRDAYWALAGECFNFTWPQRRQLVQRKVLNRAETKTL